MVLKAFDGDRVKNLNALEIEFRKYFEIMPEASERRRFLGYCEQLGIIADELE